MRNRARSLACLVLLALAQGTAAQALEGWAALAAHELESLRGGFLTQDGVRVAFGIDRMVLVGGTLETRTNLWVDDLGAPEGLAPLQALLSGISAVIQNAQDGQTIQVLTRVDFEVRRPEPGARPSPGWHRLEPPLRP